jgi:NAD dependent epimerase/dehydratase family enzyme
MIASESLFGPVNVVAPQPVTNLAFTRTLGRVLRRPTIFGVPDVLLRTVGGEMAREMLLASERVVPRKLQASGYGFKYPELEGALRHVLAGG